MTLLRILAISDIHTDSKENLAWIQDSLETVHNEGSFSVLIVAGDVSDRHEVLLETFSLLSRCFDLVFFTPGNHDVWVVGGDSGETSLEKHQRIRATLETSFDNVYCRPMSIQIQAQGALENDITSSWKIAIIPVLGWHDEKFDREPEIPCSEIGGKDFPLINQVVSDRSKAKFKVSEFMEYKQASSPTLAEKQSAESLSRVYNCLLRAFGISDNASMAQVQNWDSSLIAWRMDQLNCAPAERCLDQRSLSRIVRRPSGYTLSVRDISASVRSLFTSEKSREDSLDLEGFDKVITFSHFLPFPFLNPEKRYLFYPYLAKVIGSQYLGFRVLQVMPDIHIFGHTHFGWNATLKELLQGQGLTEQADWDCDGRILACRFVQAPLGYPRERKIRLRSMMVGQFNAEDRSRRYYISLSLQSNSCIEVKSDGAHWSDHYKKRKRDPTDTRVADYVKEVYARQ